MLPHLADVAVESVKRMAEAVTLRASCQPLPVRCPGCGMPSWRLHGRMCVGWPTCRWAVRPS